MRVKLHLQKIQIALLEMQAGNLKNGGIHVPSRVRWSLAGLGPTAYIEKERYHRKKQHAHLLRRIQYLKQQHYIERIKEGEKILYQLTSKGKYELLRLNFKLRILDQKEKKWNSKFYLAVFDVPEGKRRYRDVFRRLLKENGFKALQRSVWMSRYNPHPAIDELLNYLRMERFFEVMEIDCQGCSSRLRRMITA